MYNKVNQYFSIGISCKLATGVKIRKEKETNVCHAGDKKETAVCGALYGIKIVLERRKNKQFYYFCTPQWGEVH